MLTEIGGVSRITEACDWWSLGALLFELLTGMVGWKQDKHIQKEIFQFGIINTNHYQLKHLFCVLPATVAAPSSWDPLPHPAGNPWPPECCSCISAHRGQKRIECVFSSTALVKLNQRYAWILPPSAPQLLQFDAGYRLGSGGGGVSDIKCHPFFSSVSWKALSC